MKGKPMERQDEQAPKRPIRAKARAKAGGDKREGKKSQPGRTASIERAILKIREARLLVHDNGEYELWSLLYDAEEHMLRSLNF